MLSFGRYVCCFDGLAHMAKQHCNAISTGEEGQDCTLLFENDRLRVKSFRLQPGKRVDVTHSVPTARWQVLDGSQATPTPVFFHPGETAHLEVKEGPDALHEVVFEILQKPRRSDAEVQQWIANNRRWPAEPATAILFENEYCKLWDFRMPPFGGDRLDLHQHMLTYGFVFIKRGKLNVFVPDGDGGANFECVLEKPELGFHWNDVMDGGYDECGNPKPLKTVHAVENALDTEFREYMIELK